jgi:hypothetical protein
MAGTVNRLIPSSGPRQPEKGQISVEGAEPGYRDLRIENSLTAEHGDEVRLKKGAHVEITVPAEPVVVNDDQLTRTANWNWLDRYCKSNRLNGFQETVLFRTVSFFLKC